MTFFQNLPDAILVEDVELAGHDQHPLRREAFDVLVEELAQGRVSVRTAGIEMDSLVAVFIFSRLDLGLAIGLAEQPVEMERQILAVVGKGEDTVQVVFLVLFLGGIGKEAGHVFVDAIGVARSRQAGAVEPFADIGHVVVDSLG